MKESYARREKRQPIPKRVSGDGSATAALSIRFSFACPFGRALGFAADLYQDKHTPRLQIDFSEVVYRDYFICFGQRYQLIVKADNTTCAAFHVWDIVELLESRYVLFVRIGVLFYLNGI